MFNSLQLLSLGRGLFFAPKKLHDGLYLVAVDEGKTWLLDFPRNAKCLGLHGWKTKGKTKTPGIASQAGKWNIKKKAKRKYFLKIRNTLDLNMPPHPAG